MLSYKQDTEFEILCYGNLLLFTYICLIQVWVSIKCCFFVDNNHCMSIGPLKVFQGKTNNSYTDVGVNVGHL